MTVWPKNGGTAVKVAVDGNEYPEIVSPAPAVVSNGLESRFGFGAEVHTAPNAQNRGLKGSLQALRFTSANSYNTRTDLNFSLLRVRREIPMMFPVPPGKKSNQQLKLR